ncbi:MAG: hypothetical protein ACRCYY_11250 [Trueperaceae bacterium]
MATEKQPINARVQRELLDFLESYSTKHQLSRTNALEEAIRALKQRERDLELRQGYEAFARELAKQHDPWLDSGLEATLEGIDGAVKK